MSTHLVDDAVKNSVSQDRRASSNGRSPAAAVDAALWNFAERLLAEETLAPAAPTAAGVVALVEPPAPPPAPVVAEAEPEVVAPTPRRSFFVERRESDSTAELSLSSASLSDSTGELSVRPSVRGLPSIGRLRARKSEGSPLPPPKKLPPLLETPAATKFAEPPAAPPEVKTPLIVAAAPIADVPQAAASSVKALLARLTEARRSIPPVVAPEPSPPEQDFTPAPAPALVVDTLALPEPVVEAAAALPEKVELAVFEPLDNEPAMNAETAAEPPAPIETAPVETPKIEAAVGRPRATFSILRKLRDQAPAAEAAPVQNEILPMVVEPAPAAVVERQPEPPRVERPRPLVVGSSSPFPAIRREFASPTPRWVEEDRSRPPSLGLTLLGWFGMVMGVVGVTIAVLAVPGWI